MLIGPGVMGELFLACIAALLCAAIVVVSEPLFMKLDHLDHPGGRKRHFGGTPLSGGVSILVTVLLLGGLVDWSFRFMGFVFGAALLALLGVVDDRQHVPAVIRLGIQVAAVAIGMCAMADLQLASLGHLFTDRTVRLGDWSVAFTVFAAVGIINAVNMIDGVDGIAGGFSLLFLGVIYVVSIPVAAVDIGILSIVVGSLLGFLTFNLRTPWQKSARIFLGDAGSLMLGFTLVWFVVAASQGDNAAIAPITAVWLVGLPLCDTAYLVLARGVRGRNPMAADRSHYHHLLLRLGLTPGQTCMVWLLTAAIFMAVGIALNYIGLPDYVATYGFVGVFIVFCIAVSLLWRWLLVGRRAKSRRGVRPARSRTASR